jgi:hypothetical protein
VTALDDWVARVAEAFDLPPDAVDVGVLLDLAREVAHGVDRPAAPVTAYLVGLAVGRGTPLPDALATVASLIGRAPS